MKKLLILTLAILCFYGCKSINTESDTSALSKDNQKYEKIANIVLSGISDYLVDIIKPNYNSQWSSDISDYSLEYDGKRYSKVSLTYLFSGEERYIVENGNYRVLRSFNYSNVRSVPAVGYGNSPPSSYFMCYGIKVPGYVGKPLGSYTITETLKPNSDGTIGFQVSIYDLEGVLQFDTYKVFSNSSISSIKSSLKKESGYKIKSNNTTKIQGVNVSDKLEMASPTVSRKENDVSCGYYYGGYYQKRETYVLSFIYSFEAIIELSLKEHEFIEASN